jgi:hypothetical protein
MDQDLRGLSQEQQNHCRAAVQRFIDRHQLSDWEMTVKVRETTPAGLSVQVEITPPPASGLPPWPLQEFTVVDTSSDVAAEVEKMLELSYQDRLLESKT